MESVSQSSACLHGRTVIFANGGNGNRDYPLKEAVLAHKHKASGVVNNAVHIDTADARGLIKSGKNKWWYLEFLRDPNGYMTENWFSWGGTAPTLEDAKSYDIAEAYGPRVASILNASGFSHSAIKQGIRALWHKQ